MNKKSKTWLIIGLEMIKETLFSSHCLDWCYTIEKPDNIQSDLLLLERLHEQSARLFRLLKKYKDPPDVSEEAVLLVIELTKQMNEKEVYFWSMEVIMKRFLVVLFSLCMVLSITACGSLSATSTSEEVKASVPKFTIQIELECIGNLLFSKYDVDIYVDDTEIGTLEHGATDTFEVRLEEGTHILTVTKEDDNDVDGKVEFTVSEDKLLRYRLSLSSSQVAIEDVLVVGPTSSESTSSEPSTISTTSVESNETTEQESEVTSEETISSVESILEVTFPQEMARRAVIVAFTNRNSLDVFTDDGNAYDPSKFHSYVDDSIYLTTVYSDGTWSAKDDTTWHVEDIVLEATLYEHFLKVSFDVAYDGTNYVVSNVKGVAGNLLYLDSGDTSKLDVIDENPSDFNKYLTVTPSLVGEAGD